MAPEMFVGTPMEEAWKQYAPDPEGFRPFVERMIALEHEPLAWEDEVREARFPELDETPSISAAELKMSRALVDSFASDFQPEKFTDDYQEQLKTMIEAKLDAGDAYDTEATFGRETEEGGEVLDLMEALRRSVEQKRGGADEKKAPAKKKPAPKKKAG
jgi:DNA end-binding protein Ku